MKENEYFLFLWYNFDGGNMKSVYIHIPFCNDICTYCDFCKIYYNSEIVDKYLDALNNELSINYNGKKIETLYIGGGTPSSLSIEQLKRLFLIINNLDLSNLIEFTFECNVDSLNYDKLKLLYDNGVNRLSIGVQTFDDSILRKLNRHHCKKDIISIISIARSIGFSNINLDLIYGIQSKEILIDDIDNIIKLNPEHISCYSLSINPNTKMYIDGEKEIDQDSDYDMYLTIKKKLKDYDHYEISNYSKPGYESKHNLVYWNNDNYYGFGLGASGYINNYRYENTKNINEYISGNYLKDKYIVDNEGCIKYEIMLNLRKKHGINKELFYKKYNTNILDYNNIKNLIKDGMLIEDDKYVYISEEWKYKMNSILIKII